MLSWPLGLRVYEHSGACLYEEQYVPYNCRASILAHGTNIDHTVFFVSVFVSCASANRASSGFGPSQQWLQRQQGRGNGSGAGAVAGAARGNADGVREPWSFLSPERREVWKTTFEEDAQRQVLVFVPVFCVCLCVRVCVCFGWGRAAATCHYCAVVVSLCDYLWTPTKVRWWCSTRRLCCLQFWNLRRTIYTLKWRRWGWTLGL